MVYGKVLLVWISSVIVAAVHQSIGFSALDFKIKFITSNIFQTCSMFIPAILLIIVYCMAGIALRASTLKHENKRAMELRNKQNSTVLKMFGAITICYFVLTMPYCIWLFYFPYVIHNYPRSIQWETVVLREILLFLFYANFSINPIIYAKMHREVNTRIRRLMQNLKGACYQCSSKRNQETLLQ